MKGMYIYKWKQIYVSIQRNLQTQNTKKRQRNMGKSRNRENYVPV